MTVFLDHGIVVKYYPAVSIFGLWKIEFWSGRIPRPAMAGRQGASIVKRKVVKGKMQRREKCIISS
jgi:hypothetical protein